MPGRAPPMPLLIVWALAALAAQEQRLDISFVLPCGCHCVFLALNQGRPAQGAQEMLTIDEPFLFELFKRAAEGRSIREQILKASCAKWRSRLYNVLARLNLAARNLSLYSVRRRGATNDFATCANSKACCATIRLSRTLDQEKSLEECIVSSSSCSASVNRSLPMRNRTFSSWQLSTLQPGCLQTCWNPKLGHHQKPA